MYYLKLFDDHTEYETFTQGDGFIKPNVSRCVQENEVHYNPKTWADVYFTIESLEDNNTIYLKASNSAVTKTISASTDDGATWTEYTSSTGDSGTTLAILNDGDRLLVKGENSAYATSGIIYNQFKSTKQFEVKGNIMSLVSGDSFANADGLTATYTFGSLFLKCTGLTFAGNLSLPATTLSSNCYRDMFWGCASLTTAPQLPATTLAQACYNSMFWGCANLTTAPQLPATTLASSCYNSMFWGCASLTTAPELPAKTLTQSCYGSMFEKCTSLTTAPVLPATTLADNCYYDMFEGCTSLTTAPELPATALAKSCYQKMFQGCTSLTTAPSVLPATTLTYICYDNMFYGCASLTTAPELPATTLAESCYNGMFMNCTSLTTTPGLPSMTLVNNCYSYMFSNCTRLITAPILPATKLVERCYYSMFQGCRNLNYIKAMFTTTPSGSSPDFYTTNWVNGVASTGTFVKNAAANWNVTGVNGIPSGWTAQTATA